MSTIKVPYAPPSCFFTIEGITQQLQSPTFATEYAYLSTVFSQAGIPFPVNQIEGYTPIKWLSIDQQRTYLQQLQLFRTVYDYNSIAYSTATVAGVAPTYFKFITYKDYINYKASISLVNKLYGVQLVNDLFTIPWPPFGPGYNF